MISWAHVDSLGRPMLSALPEGLIPSGSARKRTMVAQLGQTTMQLLQKNLNIKPTLEIRPGCQFNMAVTKDLVFQKPYGLGR